MSAISETNPVRYQDATTLAALRTKQISPVEVMQAHLDRIAAVNPKLNAIVTVAGDALEAAKAAEAAVLAGNELGPLHGVPFTVKDSIDTARVLTQRGSPIFKGRIPETDATSVARLKSAGAILLAKTNLPEFSYSTETDNLLTGRSNNPWNLDRTPGGSSGGESAAIAAGMSPLGLGSDLAISIRGPAAQTGIIGLKATHGRIPMTGIWSRAPRRFWHRPDGAQRSRYRVGLFASRRPRWCRRLFHEPPQVRRGRGILAGSIASRGLVGRTWLRADRRRGRYNRAGGGRSASRCRRHR
jgi:aspartyl-tRNA(Asn)/glutamyl-tRNA(Gln) amidotransferase subunit A